MNPEDNNPLSNPFATGGMTGGPDPMAGMGATPMPDNLASAQDSLTAAGLAANQGLGGAMDLNQIAAADDATNPTALPPVEEPLVPAAPVPGSIGSAVSVPPADPVPAPAFGGFGEPAPAPGAMPAPEATPSSTPYNPFAAPSAPAAQPAPAPQPTADPAPAPAPSAPQPAPAPVPMGADKPKGKLALSPLTIVLGVAAVLLLILAITFFILWNDEKKNVKPVYYPQVSEENSNSAIKSISCQRSENQEDPAGSGRSVATISYTGDDLSAYSYYLTLDFASEDDANRMRELNATTVENMTGLIGGTLSVSGNVSGNNYSYNITSEDDVEIAAEDVMNAIYGTAEGELSLALADIQAKYEAEGFVCTEE